MCKHWIILVLIFAYNPFIYGYLHQEYLTNSQHSLIINVTIDSGSGGLIGCKVYNSGFSPQQKQINPLASNVHIIEDEYLMLAAKICSTYSTNQGLTQDLTFPGTKWCGPGNKAKNYEDLGEQAKTDTCCRAHDLCPMTIPPGKQRYGIKNDGIGLISHCSCDERFYQCLQNNLDDASDTIGILYYNIFAMKCFRKEYPVAMCLHRQDNRHQKCQQNHLHKNQPKKYQLFDPQHYISRKFG